MSNIPIRKLNKYNNISNNTEEKIKFYLLDLEIKEILFKYLEILEDSLKSQLIKVIGDVFVNKEIFREKFLEKRIEFNKQKIKELEKRYKKIDEKIFFIELTFGELVKYFKDLKREYKERIIGYYGFRKFSIFESWFFSIRHLRNLVCHGENIINRNFGEKPLGKKLYKIFNLKTNDFILYIAILEIFGIILRIDNEFLFIKLKNILNKQKNLPVGGQISLIEIEAWQVFMGQLYESFVKKQVNLNYFSEKVAKKEKITIFTENKLYDLQKVIDKIKQEGKTIVWTNGCFDILHPGHIETFKKAKSLGDILVVGLNGKESPYWKTKPGRPINDEFYRSTMLGNLQQVDYVYIFNDETPVRPVEVLKPDIVLKGGDYIQESIKNIVREENGIIDLTDVYKKMIDEGIEKYVGEKGFMSEAEINVKNGGRVVIVPIIKGCSTTNIVEKLQPKEFFDLIVFFEKYKYKFNNLKKYINWFNNKLNINYLQKNHFKFKIKQYSLFLADLGRNIGVEIEKIRPILVISSTGYSSVGDDLLIVGITDLFDENGDRKKVYKIDLVLENNYKNFGLDKSSIIRFSTIRQISKKRLIRYLGKLDKTMKNEIDKKLINILNIK